MPTQSLKREDVNVCTNGIAFVRPHIRRGIISRMVEEILDTRIMVKKAMKVHKKDKSLQKVLHSRQLGLKLIANVTFGYTAASFSGRMACVEVGDSIVRKARDTLEQAIRLVEQNEKWAAQVIYGDTDSMFVLLKDRTKQQAFVIGQEIADAVTNSNPKPVKLKLEKVYMPCILQTKKRYVGFMYETPDQVEPTFDAKGIETVRRDNCPAVSKILEKSIKILFTTCDLSLVKKYVQKQCIKILEERTPIKDFIFAKEYRGMAGYQPTACIPALEIARQRLAKDRRSEPLVGQRVPYVIVFGSPGLPLIKLVRQPSELLSGSKLRINHTYYLLKQILPPLNRFTMLFGVDAFQWYDELPRVLKANSRVLNPAVATTFTEKNDDFVNFKPNPVKNKLVNENLTKYFISVDCPICGHLTNSGMCDSCKKDDQKRVLVAACRIRKLQARQNCVNQICNICKGWIDVENSCDSLDCPVLYKERKLKYEMFSIGALLKVLDLES